MNCHKHCALTAEKNLADIQKLLSVVYEYSVVNRSTTECWVREDVRASESDPYELAQPSIARG